MTVANLGRTLWICEIRPFALAFAMVASGFRERRIPGWSYDPDGLKSITLTALAVITIPQAFVFDLFFSHNGAARIVCAVLHLYAIAWSLALAYALRTEPHVVAEGRALFRFPLLQSIDIALADIESMEILSLAPRGVPRFGLGKAGIMMRLKAPARINGPVLQRSTSGIFVAAADLNGLKGALSQGLSS